MPFQFVHATPDDIEYSAETRRRIRSQAMRDYRQRQRTEQDVDESSPEPSPPSSTENLPVRPQSHITAAAGRPKSTSQSLGVRPAGLRRDSSGTSGEFLPPIERLGVSKSKRRSPQSEQESDPSESPRQRPRRAERSRVQQGVFGMFMLKLPVQSPEVARTYNDTDELSPPAQLEQMLEICDEYNRWLVPSTATGGTRDAGALDNGSAQMLVFALSLKSLGHLEGIRPSRFEATKSFCKTKLLALLNKRLQDSSQALEDRTIGALACLASYEISQGSSEAQMHLQGLHQIIQLHGGIEKIGRRDGLRTFLEMLDLTHAVYFHTSPAYTVADRSPPSSAEETPVPPSRRPAGQPLDQHLLDDISDFILSTPKLARTGEELPTELAPVVNPTASENEVDHWHGFLAQAARSIATSHDGALAHAVDAAAALHSITTCAVRAPAVKIQKLVGELLTALSGLPDDAWDAFPMVHIRILLTALTSVPAPLLQQKSWSHAHLTRRLYRLEHDAWAPTKALMLRFIDMQARVARSRARPPVATTVLANGVEIVVDSRGAAGGGGGGGGGGGERVPLLSRTLAPGQWSAFGE